MSASLKPVKIVPALCALLVSSLFFFVIPSPAGVDANAWRLFGLFVGTIVAIIGKALPIGGVAMIGMLLVGITQVTHPGNPAASMADALSGYSNPLIWLIGISFFISRGFIKTGLGSRLAYVFVRLFGKRTLGISYGLTLTEFILAPAMPSNTARGGGVMYPIMRSISESMGSYPDEKTSRRVGAFLILVAYQINVITCAMFITSTAPNSLVISAMRDVGKINISWRDWAVAAIVPGLVSLMLVPWVVYLIYPPEVKATSNAAEFAKKKLAELGPIQLAEWIMVSVFFLLIGLWAGIPHLIFGTPLSQIDATAAAFVGLGVLLFTGVLSWDEILAEKGAWDTVTWFAALVMMATFMSKMGLVSWFATQIQISITHLGLSWIWGCVLLTVIYVFVHYFFASNTAHISALYASFFGVGVAMGAPPIAYGLLLGFCSSLCASLTHYGTGSAPVLFGSGYVPLGAWWKVGFVITVLNLSIWFVVGSLWWKILGLW